MSRSTAIKRTRSKRRFRAKRRGYVLLMTLALLVIAALSEAGLARRSLQTALEATQAQAELQRRWAAASCREFLLDQADGLFIQLEDAKRRPRWPAPRELRARFTLGGQTVEVVLADEDAKTNLNALHARKPADVRIAVLEAVHGALVPELRPDVSSEAKIRRRFFASWGQVFNVASVLAAPDGWERLAKASAEITCWGQGKPNIRRASDRTVETAAASVVGRESARKLLAARRQADGDLLLADLLAGLDLKRTEQVKLRSVLGDRSTCYSLWMTLGDGRRTVYHLWVQGDHSVPGGALAFHW